MGSDPRGWLGPQRRAARQAPGQGFKPPLPGRRSADWKFHIDRHQPRAKQQLLGGAIPALRVYPRVQTPKLHLQPRSQLQSRGQPPSTWTTPSGTGPTPPD